MLLALERCGAAANANLRLGESFGAAEIISMRNYKVRPASGPCWPGVAKVDEHTLSFRYTARIVVDGA
jgi:hypothetical protein